MEVETDMWVHFTSTKMLSCVGHKEGGEPWECFKDYTVNDNNEYVHITETVIPKLATPFIDVLKYKGCGLVDKDRSFVWLESVSTGTTYPINLVDFFKLLASGQSSLGYKCWWGYKDYGWYKSLVPFVKPLDEVFSEEAKLLAVSVLHGDSVAAMALTDKVMEELS